MFQIDQYFPPTTVGAMSRNAASTMRHRMFTFAWNTRRENELHNEQAWSFDTETKPAPIDRLNQMLADFSTFYEPPSDVVQFLWKTHGPNFEIWFATFKVDVPMYHDDNAFVVVGRFQYATEATLCKMAL